MAEFFNAALPFVAMGLTIALLAGIESLLACVVADSMTGTLDMQTVRSACEAGIIPKEKLVEAASAMSASMAFPLEQPRLTSSMRQPSRRMRSNPGSTSRRKASRSNPGPVHTTNLSKSASGPAGSPSVSRPMRS